MIRFIDLGRHVGLDSIGPRQFAFFNTRTNRFIEMDGEHVWVSWYDFVMSYRPSSTSITPDRFRAVCKDWVFTANKGDN